MKKLGLVLFMLFVIGCVHTYDIKTPPSVAGAVLLSTDAGFYVAVPADGRFGEKVYPGSGQTTAASISFALSAMVTRLEVGDVVETRAQALGVAKERNLDYVFESTILHWEDRATEWSGKRDKVSIRVQVVDVSTGNVVSSAAIQGKSKWATFGGDHPQELLQRPLSEYVASLFEGGN